MLELPKKTHRYATNLTPGTIVKVAGATVRIVCSCDVCEYCQDRIKSSIEKNNIKQQLEHIS